MKSIRTRFTMVTVLAVVIAVSIATTIGVISIQRLGSSDTDQMLLLLCSTGEKNLDSYFESVEQSVSTVASLVQDDLDGVSSQQLSAHVERVRSFFGKVAYQTNGVLTYYYRIDPEVSDTVRGFWYTNLGGDGFVEHAVTDITRYDTSDTSNLVWFTVPKFTGRPIWLPPYTTDNLDVQVISYNVPVYWRGQFVGVIGIEIDYSTMAQEVNHLRLYNHGYAFITDSDGNLVYHPNIDLRHQTEETALEVPEGLLSDDTHIRYRYDGIEKVGVWLPLNNGMRLTVSVPLSEVNSRWHSMIREILIASALVLLLITLFNLHFAGRLTKPLRELTAAAEQVNSGDFSFDLDYNGDDEVGILTRSFKRLVEHLRVHISDLNKRVFIDALTSVRNRGAFANYIQELQDESDAGEPLVCAIGIFDCDSLKTINDQYGHEKGDIYLRAASQLICTVFQHSPVFRIGGDEFAVVLQNIDFLNREDLFRQFEEDRAAVCQTAQAPWAEVHLAYGIAVYDPKIDRTVIDTVRRADKSMYENKRKRKQARAALANP